MTPNAKECMILVATELIIFIYVKKVTITMTIQTTVSLINKVLSTSFIIILYLNLYLTNSTLTNSIALFCFLDATPTPPPTTEPPGKWHLAPTGKFKTD